MNFMSQSLSNLLYHIVFSTKNRMNLIAPEFENELYLYIGGIVRGQKGRLLQIGGTHNHIHMLAVFHPSVSFSDMMRYVKGGSSKWIHDKGVSMFQWQRGYGAFAVSESLSSQVIGYIQNQKKNHGNLSFEQEFIALLEKHRIEYDEKYIWD
jgi:putative transposase